MIFGPLYHSVKSSFVKLLYLFYLFGNMSEYLAKFMKKMKDKDFVHTVETLCKIMQMVPLMSFCL